MYSRAPADPTVRTFEATVTGVDGQHVVLDETWFYPEGGGQPADRGSIAGVDVVDVQHDGEAVVHSLSEGSETPTEGAEVTCVVDDDFRTYCMRAHTASHVLYGAGRRLLDDLGYGGFDISPEKVRVDFETSTTIDDARLVELERLVNRVVWESREVTWEQMPVDGVPESVAFNTKTEEGVMADSETVRVVRVDGWDDAACGGTHVSNTSEIGPVEVLERSNPGEGLTRVEFAVGAVGIDRRTRLHEAALDAARTAGVGIEDLPGAVEKLQQEVEELEAERDSLRARLLDDTVASLPASSRDGVDWRVGNVTGFDANAVGEAAKRAVDGGVVAIVGRENEAARPFVVVASGGAVNAGDVVGGVTDEFGGGGGGGPPFAQGGGLDADPDAVVSALREGS